MKVLAIERSVPGVSDANFTDELLREEASKAWELHMSGDIRELYFRSDEDAAVLVLECEDAAQAKSILSRLPLVQRGLIDFELIPLKSYPGFERLFAG
jgi:muconolactone delta-isomerase